MLSLVNFSALKHAWTYSKADFAAMLVTILVTLIEGIEPGLIAGVGLSIILHLYKTSRPHIAIVGQIPGTKNFRNEKNYDVVTYPGVLSIRIDESLYFPNARYIEDFINDAVAENPEIKDIILECPAINSIDLSALESLEAINARLKDGGITLHMSELKNPVLESLKKSSFLEEMTGRVFLSNYDAVSSIVPDLTKKTLDAPRLNVIK